MVEKENMTILLRDIADKLKKVIADKEIKVIINNQNRTISFLTYCFAIPSPDEKEKYVSTWKEIFSVFDSEKEKIETLRKLEIIKKKKREKLIKEQREEALSYTQNLNYINDIIERNTEPLQKEEKTKPKTKKETKKVSGFKYGVKISMQDDMKNSDWFDLEESDFDFVILHSGKQERKFKNYVKKCREHSLCFGAFFEGFSLTLLEAKKEATLILNKLEEYDIKGPVIYEINNKIINVSAKDINTLSSIISSISYIFKELSSKGYNAILNVDLNTISILVDNEVLSLGEIPIVYNVLPSQTHFIDDSCQIIEFNPKDDYEKIRLSCKLLENKK